MIQAEMVSMCLKTLDSNHTFYDIDDVITDFRRFIIDGKVGLSKVLKGRSNLVDSFFIWHVIYDDYSLECDTSQTMEKNQQQTHLKDEGTESQLSVKDSTKLNRRI